MEVAPVDIVDVVGREAGIAVRFEDIVELADMTGEKVEGSAVAGEVTESAGGAVVGEVTESAGETSEEVPIEDWSVVTDVEELLQRLAANMAPLPVPVPLTWNIAVV